MRNALAALDANPFVSEDEGLESLFSPSDQGIGSSSLLVQRSGPSKPSAYTNHNNEKHSVGEITVSAVPDGLDVSEWSHVVSVNAYESSKENAKPESQYAVTKRWSSENVASAKDELRIAAQASTSIMKDEQRHTASPVVHPSRLDLGLALAEKLGLKHLAGSSAAAPATPQTKQQARIHAHPKHDRAGSSSTHVSSEAFAIQTVPLNVQQRDVPIMGTQGTAGQPSTRSFAKSAKAEMSHGPHRGAPPHAPPPAIHIPLQEANTITNMLLKSTSSCGPSRCTPGRVVQNEIVSMPASKSAPQVPMQRGPSSPRVVLPDPVTPPNTSVANAPHKNAAARGSGIVMFTECDESLIPSHAKNKNQSLFEHSSLHDLCSISTITEPSICVSETQERCSRRVCTAPGTAPDVYGRVPTPEHQGQKEAEEAGPPEDASRRKQAITLLPSVSQVLDCSENSSSDYDDEDGDVPEVFSPAQHMARQRSSDWSFVPKGESPNRVEDSSTTAHNVPNQEPDPTPIEALAELARAEQELTNAVMNGGGAAKQAMKLLLNHKRNPDQDFYKNPPSPQNTDVEQRSCEQQKVSKTYCSKSRRISQDTSAARVVVYGGYTKAGKSRKGDSNQMVTGMESCGLNDMSAGVWQRFSGPAKTRGAGGLALAGGCLWAVGGFDGSKVLDDAERVQVNSAAKDGKQAWSAVEGLMKSPRMSCGLATVGECILAIGGSDGKSVLSTVDILNTKECEWFRAPEVMEKGRAAFGCAVMGKCAFVVGGYDDRGKAIATAEMYDTVSGKWSTLPGRMRNSRLDCGVCFVGDLFFVVGGRNSSGSMLKSCEIFDMHTRTWRVAEGLLNVARAGAGVVALGDKIYAVGGSAGDGLLSSVEEYNMKEGGWKLLPSSLRHAMGACRALVLDGAC